MNNLLESWKREEIMDAPIPKKEEPVMVKTFAIKDIVFPFGDDKV